MKMAKIAMQVMVVSVSMWSTVVMAAPALNAGQGVCPVSGQEIGAMGEGYPVMHAGQKYTLCCKGCARKFYKNPDQYIHGSEMDQQGHQH